MSNESFIPCDVIEISEEDAKQIAETLEDGFRQAAYEFEQLGFIKISKEQNLPFNKSAVEITEKGRAFFISCKGREFDTPDEYAAFEKAFLDKWEQDHEK